MSEENEETAVEVKKPLLPMADHGVVLHSMEDAWRFASTIAPTAIVPLGLRGKPAEVFAVVQAGAEMGLSPFRSLSNMKCINGRVGPMGALAKALIRKADVLEKGTGFMEQFSGTEGEDDWTAHFSTLRAGETDRYHTTFSVKDAKLAGLWGKKSKSGAPGPWCQYPKRMLMWRAVGFHMDDYYSDVLMGFHIAEVLEDYPEEIPRGAATMQPLEEPTRDPLLDQLKDHDGDNEAALEAVAEELQPQEAAEAVGDIRYEVRSHLPLGIVVTDADVDVAIALVGQKDAAFHLIDMHEKAMGDQIRDAMPEVKDEDLADPDLGNAAPEGGADDLGF